MVTDRPFGTYPTVLFEFVKRWIEVALADLQNFAGDLVNALRDGPSVHGLERDDFQDEQIQGALDEIRGFTQSRVLCSYQ